MIFNFYVKTNYVTQYAIHPVRFVGSICVLTLTKHYQEGYDMTFRGVYPRFSRSVIYTYFWTICIE